jgi:signal transduction histidine kinase
LDWGTNLKKIALRNSLLFKLIGAFFLVIAIGSLVLSILTSRATQNAFNLYTTRSGQIWAQRLVPILTEYYSQSNSWEGVDSVIQSTLGNPDLTSGSGNTPGQGRGFGQGQQIASGEMIGVLGQRLILTDNNGMIISDSLDELIGKQLSTAEIKYGTPILVNDNLVGTILFTPVDFSGKGTPGAEFLASVNQAIISSAIIAGVIALILGAILFFQITAPLRKLRKAATAITNGDLNQRVIIKSKDELGELGNSFNNMAESLTKAETQRQHLMADVAHELRTPLAAIQGTLEGMQDGVLPLDGEQLTALHAETTLLNRLIGDLRLLSLAEAGQLKLELQKIEPGKIIQEIIERMKPQANQKEVRLVADIEASLPEPLLDPDRITQVLNNLISNALRYTPQGGTITVHVAKSKNAESLMVSVTDTGVGIDRENLPYVFDRFYRADKSRSRSSGGSGLGLAIVKQLVEAHGGKVHVESPVFQEKDQKAFGTTITFSLPVH